MPGSVTSVEGKDSSSGMTNSTPTRCVITDSCPPVRHNQLPSHLVSLSPLLRESYLTAEYCLLSNQPKLGGVYAIPSAATPNLWFGVLFVHYGVYQGGVFRFTIQFHEHFPDSGHLPVVCFHPPIFHPQIHPTKGIFNLKSYLRSGWIRGSNHVWQVLKILKNSFYKVDTSHPLDKFAAEMYENNAENFIAKATQEVELSVSRVYDEPQEGHKDDHYIRFSVYDPAVHNDIRAKALQPMFSVSKNPVRTDEAAKKGLSFMSDSES